MTGDRLQPAAAAAKVGERLLGRVDALAIELTERIRQAEPFYDKGNVVSASDLRASINDNLLYILARLAGRPTPGLDAARATGRRRAEQGAPLPAILHSYRVAGTAIWAMILEDGLAHGEDTASLLGAASELWSTMDELSGAVTDAYRDTIAERARSSSQTRNAMLDALLRGDLGDGSRLWESAATLALPHRGHFVVVAAHVPRPGVESFPQPEETLRAKGIQSTWRVEIDAHVGVIVLDSRNGIDQVRARLGELLGGPAGLSTPYTALDQTPAALRQARLAHAAATPGSREVVRFEEVPVAVLLASAPEAAAGVAQAILGPVLALPAAECEMLLGTLRTWFAEDGATSVAAEKLHLHRNTVRYRLHRLEELTGRSLIKPTGVAELHLALEAARILRLPTSVHPTMT